MRSLTPCLCNTCHRFTFHQPLRCKEGAYHSPYLHLSFSFFAAIHHRCIEEGAQTFLIHKVNEIAQQGCKGALERSCNAQNEMPRGVQRKSGRGRGGMEVVKSSWHTPCTARATHLLIPQVIEDSAPKVQRRTRLPKANFDASRFHDAWLICRLS